VKSVHLVGFITKKFVMMHGHMNEKFRSYICCSLYSLDMAPCDLFLFSKMKMLLKGNSLQDMEQIK